MMKKIISILLIAASVLSFSACGKKAEADFSQVQEICELATLECFYHNVCELKQESSSVLAKAFGNIGYKKVWIEYDGVVKLGIDASKVRIEPEGTKVNVFVPEATFISCDIDDDSVSESIKKTGWFTKVTIEERDESIKQAQNEMEEKAKNNSALFSQAESRAKKIVENYILGVGKKIGVEYEIVWEDK